MREDMPKTTGFMGFWGATNEDMPREWLLDIKQRAGGCQQLADHCGGELPKDGQRRWAQVFFGFKNWSRCQCQMDDCQWRTFVQQNCHVWNEKVGFPLGILCSSFPRAFLLGHNWYWNWFPQHRKDSPCCWHVRQTHTRHGQKFDYSIPILRNGHQFINRDEEPDYKDAHHGITHMRMLRTRDGMVRKRSARKPAFPGFLSRIRTQRLKTAGHLNLATGCLHS